MPESWGHKHSELGKLKWQCWLVSEAHSLGAEEKSSIDIYPSPWPPLIWRGSFSHLNSPGRPSLHRLLPFALRQCVSLEYSGGLVTGVGGVLSMEDIAGAGAAVVCA